MQKCCMSCGSTDICLSIKFDVTCGPLMSMPNAFALKTESACCVNIRGVFSAGSGSYGSRGCCLMLGGRYFSRILAANSSYCSRRLVSFAILFSLVLCRCSLAKYLGVVLSVLTLSALLNSCSALFCSILALICLSLQIPPWLWRESPRGSQGGTPIRRGLSERAGATQMRDTLRQ